MAREKQGPSAEQTRYTHHEFTDSLYQKIIEWLESSPDTQVVAEFGPQMVEKWEHGPGRRDFGPLLPHRLNLHQAVIAQIGNIFIGVSVGEGFNNRYAWQEALRLQFGYEKAAVFKDTPQTIEDLKKIVGIPIATWRHQGEFSTDDLGRLTVNCWADASTFGGRDLARWPPEKLLTKKGVTESLTLIQFMLAKASWHFQ